MLIKNSRNKKILYCASTTSHILNFHLPYLEYFKEQGWEVDVLVGDFKEVDIPHADNVIRISMLKNVLSLQNLLAVKQIKKLLKESQYDIVSTHTALAGAIVRLAIKLNGKKRTEKIIHTSHGYFFNGLGGIAECTYILIEKILSDVTDILMVMNQIDYGLARRFSLARQIEFISGMGIDLSKFKEVTDEDKRNLKASIGCEPNDFVVLYAAEMSKRKNQGELLRAFAKAAKKEPSLKLILAGDGKKKATFEKLTNKLGINSRVLFLGYVSKINKLYSIADLVVSTSRCEGLPFNVMEAMANGLPVVASRIKGHIDLLERPGQDLMYNLFDKDYLSDLIVMVHDNRKLRKEISEENIVRVQQYSIDVVKPKIISFYN